MRPKLGTPDYDAKLLDFVLRNAWGRFIAYRIKNRKKPTHVRLGGQADMTTGGINIFNAGDKIRRMTVVRGPCESTKIEVGNFVD
jgi:hypothetical protein